MIKRQTRTILICCLLFAVLLAAHLFVIQPLLKEAEEQEAPPTLLPGEVLGTSNRIMMFEQVEKADLYRLEVHNEHGGYTFYRGDDDEFYIEDMEGAPYSLELFSSMVVSAGFTLSMKRLDDVSPDLSVYGLGENDDPAWYLLTKMDGTQHKVIIGDMILTGAGYYCMYEGRNAVYILNNSLSSTLLADVCDLIQPSLSYPVSQSTYLTVDDMMLFKEGELFLWLDAVPNSESGKTTGVMDYVFKHPAQYTPNLETYGNLLTILQSLAGTETVLCGSQSTPIDVTHLEEYGIDTEKPYFRIHYVCEKVESDVLFSEPDETGMMYAYSTLYNLVAKISVASASFVSWDLLTYVNPSLFTDNINDMAKIEVKGTLDNGDEKLDVDAFFTLEGSGTDIVVKENGAAKGYSADDLQNFRQLYIVMVGLRLQGYADVTDTEGLTPMAELTLTTDSGEVRTFRFYAYNTRRCLYTVNGKGEFYLLRDNVEKMLRDTDRMLKRIPIDFGAKD